MNAGQFAVRLKSLPWRRISSIAGNVLLAWVLAMLLIMSLFLVKSRLDGDQPQFFGHRFLVVTSGSMSPAFGAGSVVAVRATDPAELAEGDVITYRDPVESQLTITHRIVAVDRENMEFITRGDANNTDDPVPVAAENIVGRVALAIPAAGYVLNFVQTRTGLLLLIIVPGLAIVVYELWGLWRDLNQAQEEAKGGGSK